MKHPPFISLFRFFAAIDALYFGTMDAVGAEHAVSLSHMFHPGILLLVAFAIYEAVDLFGFVRGEQEPSKKSKLVRKYKGAKVTPPRSKKQACTATDTPPAA